MAGHSGSSRGAPDWKGVRHDLQSIASCHCEMTPELDASLRHRIRSLRRQADTAADTSEEPKMPLIAICASSRQLQELGMFILPELQPGSQPVTSDIFDMDDLWTRWGGTLPIEAAISSGQEKLVERLMQIMMTRTPCVKLLKQKDDPTSDQTEDGDLDQADDSDSHLTQVQYPLFLAAIQGDVEVMEAILKADPKAMFYISTKAKDANDNTVDSEDEKGDNVIHAIIRHREQLSEKSAKRSLMTTDIDEKHNNEEHTDALNPGEIVYWILERTKKMDTGIQGVNKLLYQRGSTGIRPLQVAVKFGAYTIVEAIVNFPGVYTITNSIDRYKGVHSFNIADIETSYDEFCTILGHKKCRKRECYQWQRDTNCLHQLKSCKNRPGSYKIAEMEPFKSLIETKWKYYKKSWSALSVIHFLVMAGYAAVMNYRIVYTDGEDFWTYFPTNYAGNGTLSIINTNECYEVLCWMSFFAHCTVAAYSVVLLLALFAVIGLLIDRRRNKAKEAASPHNGWRRVAHRTTDHFKDGEVSTYFNITMFSVAAISALATHRYAYRYEPVCVSTALVAGWWMLLSFGRCFSKGVNYFSSMINQSITQDLVKFLFVYSLLLIGFSNAMFISFQSSENRPYEFETFMRTTYTLVKFSLGIVDIEGITQAEFPELVYFITISFLLLTYLLLLNFLLAIINHNYGSGDSQQAPMYTVQRNATIAFLELRRRNAHKQRSGKSFLDVNGLGGRRFEVAASKDYRLQYINRAKIDSLPRSQPKSDEQLVQEFIYAEGSRPGFTPPPLVEVQPLQDV